MKTCAKCQVKKKNSEFHKRKATKSGLVSTCKECKTLIGKVYYHENRFIVSEKNRTRYRNKYK